VTATLPTHPSPVEPHPESPGSSAPAASVAALRLGPLSVDPPVVLAPMAGVTNSAFRQLCRSYGAGLYVSEMITARALVEGNAKTLGMASFAEDEPVRSVQLCGVDPRVMGAAVRRLVGEIGVDHIDLNFGCPAAKVTRQGAGAALPVHRALFREIIAAAVGASGSVPVTVKLRKGVDDEHLTYLESGAIAADEGAAAITLHARTAEQLYSGQADWGAIARLKDTVASIPVLGNGDLWEASDALAMVRATGCDGVVIGRGCLGRPWLFRDLADEFAGRPRREPPSLGEVTEMMRSHVGLLCLTFGDDLGVRQFRKHSGWYLTGFPVGPAVRRSLAQAGSPAEVHRLIDTLDTSLPFPREALRMARGHTNGPRPVRLPSGWLDSVDDPRPPTGGDVLVSGG
jgi:nifR3 family TIM-barrel protein